MPRFPPRVTRATSVLPAPFVMNWQIGSELFPVMICDAIVFSCSRSLAEVYWFFLNITITFMTERRKKLVASSLALRPSSSHHDCVTRSPASEAPAGLLVLCRVRIGRKPISSIGAALPL